MYANTDSDDEKMKARMEILDGLLIPMTSDDVYSCERRHTVEREAVPVPNVKT